LNLASHTGDSQQAPRDTQVPDRATGLRSELLAALSGRDANRERAVAHRTRRVVLSSLGVLREQKQDRSRVRGVALAMTLIVLLLIAPLLWEATDSLIAGEHFGDPGNLLSLWACILCPTMLGAALVAGWWKHRS
jgi:hypothetical protein